MKKKKVLKKLYVKLFVEVKMLSLFSVNISEEVNERLSFSKSIGEIVRSGPNDKTMQLCSFCNKWFFQSTQSLISYSEHLGAPLLTENARLPLRKTKVIISIKKTYRTGVLSLVPVELKKNAQLCYHNAYDIKTSWHWTSNNCISLSSIFLV